MAAGWQYRTLVFDPDAGETEEQWATRIAREGWRMWQPGPGSWMEVGGKRVRRWSVRRWVERPLAVEGFEGRIWATPPVTDQWGRVKGEAEGSTSAG